MKKKPSLKKIIENLNNYTIEELENIKGQPLWIRKQLVDLKKRDNIAPEISAEQMADAMENNILVELPKNKVYRWIGNTWFMPCGMSGGMKIEINYGDLLFIEFLTADKIKVKLSSSIGYLTTSDRIKILNNIQYIDDMTIPEYAALVSQELSKTRKSILSSSKIDNKELFQIIRHYPN